MVRGTCPLPHGSGKQVRVLVFAEGDGGEGAKEAGAEYVGFKDMIQKCQEGFQDFDVAIATPAAMAEVRKLGKVLGPRGLMPNPKTGTVTDDTAKAVREVKAGRVEFKLDKNGNVAVPVGKFSFAENALVENGTAVIEAVVRARPATAKGRFVEGMTLSATMSPGVHVDPSPYLASERSNLEITLIIMRPEKASIVSDLSEKLNRSPFLLVTDYQRMKVDQFGELRNRLAPAGAEVRVVKNSFLKRAMADSGLPDVADKLSGQTAIVMGEKDVAPVAKILKTFAAEFKIAALKIGVVDQARFCRRQKWRRWRNCRRAKFCWRNCLDCCLMPGDAVWSALLNEPASALARLLNAKAEKGGQRGSECARRRKLAAQSRRAESPALTAEEPCSRPQHNEIFSREGRLRNNFRRARSAARQQNNCPGR